MLFAVVALLFVCIGPQSVARLLYELYGTYYHTTPILFTCLSQQLVFLNASLNFALYCLVSRRYRELLRDSLYGALRREKAWCTTTGAHLRSLYSTLVMSPSTTTTTTTMMPMAAVSRHDAGHHNDDERCPMLLLDYRRASAPPLTPPSLSSHIHTNIG